MFIEPDADGCEISDDFSAIGIVADEHRALAAATRRLRKRTAQCGFGRAGKAGNEDHRTAIVAATQHGIEPRDTAGDALVRHLRVSAAERAGYGDLQSFGTNQERSFIFLEARTAIFLNTQIALRHTFHHAVVQDDSTVNHELQNAKGAAK